MTVAIVDAAAKARFVEPAKSSNIFVALGNDMSFPLS